MFKIDKTPYTWDVLKDKISNGDPLGRTDEMERKYEEQTDEERDAFIADIRRQIDKHRIVILKNRFPYRVERGIEHYVIWSKTPHDPYLVAHESWLNTGTNKYLAMRNDAVHMSIPEIYHTHLFVRDIRHYEDRRLPKYLAHFTTLTALSDIGRTKIGNKQGFLCAKYNLHMLGFQYDEEIELEGDPMKVFDVEYNGVYFAPIFDERKIKRHNGYFRFPNILGQLEVCLLMSTNALRACPNWHYNFDDDAGEITDATVFSTQRIVYSEKPEVVFHDTVSLENISAIITTNARFLEMETFFGIPILADFPAELPEPQRFSFVGPLGYNMDLAARHNHSVRHHSK